MPAFPSNVPAVLLVAGQTIEPVSNATPIDVESGEPLSRRRFTGAMDRIAGTLPPLVTALALEVYNFWRDTLEDGSLPFTMPHPLTGVPMETMFLSPPKLTRITTDQWSVSVDLQTMPL